MMATDIIKIRGSNICTIVHKCFLLPFDNIEYNYNLSDEAYKY